MKLLAITLLALAALAAAQDPTLKQDGVVDLTPDNIATVHDGKRAALIEFYAPWCGHCKRLVPEYAKLGAKVAGDPKLKNRVLIAKVDADAHRSLGEKFSVRGFPTIKWFPRGLQNDPVDYQGGRTLDDFLKFINEKVSADAGFARVDALVPLAQKFHTAADADKKAVLAEAEKVAAGVAAEDKDSAALYLRFMKKAVEKGGAYIATELARLEKMAEKPMSAAKLDEVSRKVSVLSSFTEDPAAATEPAAAAEPAADQKAAAKAEEHDEGDEYELEDEDEDEPAAGGAAAADDDDDEVYADGLDDEPEAAGAGAAEEDEDEYEDSEL